MIQRRVIINLIVFFGLTGLLITYGFFTLVHNPLSRPLRLSAFVEDTGGVRSGFTVAMRGVPIGHVGSVGLDPRTKKVKLGLDIEPDVTVPSNAEVQVERANPLGEQQVDLLPPATAAAPARDGAVLAETATPTPPDVGQVVAAADRLFSSIPTADLQTVIHEMAVALAGNGQNLRTIIEASDVVSKNFLAYQDAFRQLLADAPPVLDTVAAVGPQLQQALVNTQSLLDFLNQRKGDIINLFHTSTSFSAVADQLIDQNAANLACLTHDLADVGGNLSVQSNLTNLTQALDLNRFFFGPVNAITPAGHAASLGPGSVDRNNQNWFRVRLLLPPQQPSAVSYAQPNQIPDTYPGAACLSVFGAGVPAGSQAHPAPPVENGKVIAPAAPTVPVEQMTGPAPAGGGTGPGNVIPGKTPPPPPVSPTAHPETSLYVGAGLVGLGWLERREIRRLRRIKRQRTRRRTTRRAR